MGGGNFIINGIVSLGRGCRICIGKKGILQMGNNFRCTGDTTFYCYHKITFGDSCLLSWNISIMDTDFHVIRDASDYENILNDNAPITIGDHVWIGSNSTILKNVAIPSDCIVAAGSLVSNSRIMDEERSIYGGSGKTLVKLKNNVVWTID